MKIWKIVRDTDYETSCDVFTDESAAQSAFDIEILYYREKYGDENDSGPDDSEEVMAWAEERGCIDLVYLEAADLPLPAVYEGGPELLECLKEALEVMGDWGPEGEPGWATRTRQIVNKAEGK